jgi:hypothetical protein
LVNEKLLYSSLLGVTCQAFLPLQSSAFFALYQCAASTYLHAKRQLKRVSRDVHCRQRGEMNNSSLFVPEMILEALRSDLATGLRAIADALDGQQLDGKFVGANAAAGGRYDNRLHLRIVLDMAAPGIQSSACTPSTLKRGD